MGPEVQPRDRARRNRQIAIAARAITVTAIVLGFAGDFLGLPWHWMRPAAELLLLAELVGLVVLERREALARDQQAPQILCIVAIKGPMIRDCINASVAARLLTVVGKIAPRREMALIGTQGQLRLSFGGRD